MNWFLGLSGHESPIPIPSSFNIEPVKIRRADRTASGNKVIDIIAIKNNYKLTYEFLTASEVAIFKTEYLRDKILSFKYPDGGVIQTVAVDFVRFPRRLQLEEPEYWTGITIELEEV